MFEVKFGNDPKGCYIVHLNSQFAVAPENNFPFTLKIFQQNKFQVIWSYVIIQSILAPCSISIPLKTSENL